MAVNGAGRGRLARAVRLGQAAAATGVDAVRTIAARSERLVQPGAALDPEAMTMIVEKLQAAQEAALATGPSWLRLTRAWAGWAVRQQAANLALVQSLATAQSPPLAWSRWVGESVAAAEPLVAPALDLGHAAIRPYRRRTRANARRLG